MLCVGCEEDADGCFVSGYHSAFSSQEETSYALDRELRTRRYQFTCP